MKSPKLLLSVLALAVVASASVLRAEDAPPAPAADAPAHKPHGDRLKELAEKLALTDDQKAKIAPILKDELQAMKAVRDDTSIDKQDKHAKMMDIRKSHAAQILAILTPDQQAKFKAMHEHHMAGPDAPKPAAPTP